MELKVGQQITAPFLSATAEVKKFEPRSGYFLLEVVLHDGHHTYKPLRITDEQLAQIEVLEQSPVALTDNAEDFFFLIEAHRIRLAYQFDPQLAVSISQVDPLPHQIEAVYRYVLESPRIRFLIADDPGAGKTIMAGLILKELQYRRLVRRVLIVAPGHLKYQWQREMKERFQTSFAVIDRARMESAWGENVWEERDYCITSIDFIKQDAVRATLRGTHWDLIVVDEAHKMSAYAYHGRERIKIDKTKRYQVGEPRILGAAVVLPLIVAELETGPETVTYEPRTPEPVLLNEERAEYKVGADMHRDEEIEAVGMRAAMAYEREHGWHPEDVSGENHGFDLRSTRYNPDGTFADIRYIEVKARARSGAIRLSSNEWKKARHFDDKFWLYIVTDAATDTPQLYHIQNPAAHFRMDEEIFATGFIIPEEKWRKRTEDG